MYMGPTSSFVLSFIIFKQILKINFKKRCQYCGYIVDYHCTLCLSILSKIRNWRTFRVGILELDFYVPNKPCFSVTGSKVTMFSSSNCISGALTWRGPQFPCRLQTAHGRQPQTVCRSVPSDPCSVNTHHTASADSTQL